MKVKSKKTEVAVNNHEIEVTRAHQFNDGTIEFDMKIGGDITIYGNRLVDGKNGIFVSFPSRKGNDGNYYSHVFIKLSEDDVASIVAQIEKL